EDVIRHRNVTGVQTCALPILGRARSQRWSDGGEAGGAGSESQAARWWRVGNIVGPGRTQAAQQREARGGIDGSTGQELALHGPRSEERRVGKEGRRGGGWVWW